MLSIIHPSSQPATYSPTSDHDAVAFETLFASCLKIHENSADLFAVDGYIEHHDVFGPQWIFWLDLSQLDAEQLVHETDETLSER